LSRNRNTNIDSKYYRNKLNLFMRRGGTVLINTGVVSGQGTSTLTLTNSVVADAGSYDVVVSGTCTPAVTSSPVTVTVNAAPIAPAFTQVNPTCLVGTGSVSVTSPVSGSIP
jgi:hypothetical protein